MQNITLETLNSIEGYFLLHCQILRLQDSASTGVSISMANQMCPLFTGIVFAFVEQCSVSFDAPELAHVTPGRLHLRHVSAP